MTEGPLPPPVATQSGAQAPSDGSLMARDATGFRGIPSMTAPVQQIPGSQQLTADPRVAAQTAVDTTRTQVTGFEKMAMFTGEMEKGIGRIVTSLRETADHVEASAKNTGKHLSRTASSHSPFHPGGSQPHAAGSGVDTPLRSSPASRGGATRAAHTALLGGMPEGSMGDPAAWQQELGRRQEAWATSYSDVVQGGHVNLGNLRTNIAQGLNRRVSEMNDRARMTQDAQGNWTDAATGRVLEPEEAAHRARTLSRMGQADAALSSIGGGATVTSGLLGLTKYAGVAGAALTAATFARDQVVNQRAQNAYYQQIYGGSNVSQFAQRGREMAFGYSQMFGMGEGQARELFRGVSSMGLQGGERQNAMNFATSEYNRIGMSVSDSLQLISEAARNGVTNFGSLRDVLKETSDAARAGGLNLGEVNRQLTQNYAQVAQSGITGTSTGAVAGGLTAAMAAQGQTMQGVNLTAGLTSEQSMRMMAAQSNMSYGQFIAQTNRNPAAFGQAAQNLINQRTNMLVPAGLRTTLQAQAAQRSAQTGGRLSEGGIQDLANQLLASGQVDPSQIQQVMQNITGQTLNASQAAEFLVRTQFGGINVAHDIARQVQSGSVHPQSETGIRTGAAGRRLTVNDAGHALTAQDQDVAKAWVSMGFKSMANPANQMGDPDPMRGGSFKDTSAYGNFMRQTGMRIPEIESLLKDNPDSSRRFLVQTSKGQREVGLDEAIKHYRDQLAAGTAIVARGSGQGHSVADITGISDPKATTDPSRVGMAGSSDTAAPSKGAKMPGKGSAGSGSIAIYPTPLLQQILGFSTSGGAYVANARTTGTPASPFPPNLLDLSTATGGP